MEFPTSLPEAQNVMQSFSEDGEVANLPDFTKEKVKAALRELNMADQMVKFGEAIYANAANVNAAARNAAAQVIGFASGFTGYGPYHGLQNDNRGARIVSALRRRNGHTPPEGAEGWPPSSEDPAPLAEMNEEDAAQSGAVPPVPPSA